MQCCSDLEHHSALYGNVVQFSQLISKPVPNIPRRRYAEGNHWFAQWPKQVHQSFRATGTALYSASLRCAGPVGSDIEVRVRAGNGPSGALLGPPRTLTCNSMNAQAVFWSANEVPTVPGQTYTLQYTGLTPAGFAPWHQTVLDYGASEIPDGQLWHDGQLVQSGTLEVSIEMNDGDLIASFVAPQFELDHAVTSRQCGGQIFTSQGSAVLAVTWAGQGPAANPGINACAATYQSKLRTLRSIMSRYVN